MRNGIVGSMHGRPEPGSVAKSPHREDEDSSLRPDTITLGLGDVTIVAILDATKPADARLRVHISAIQPAAVLGAFHGVYAGLIDGVSVTGHSNQHVISSGCVIPNAAASGTAMV